MEHGTAEPHGTNTRGRRSCDGWSNKHARILCGAGPCFAHDPIKSTRCMLLLVCEQCPNPRPRSTQEQRRNAHTTQHALPRLHKWFHMYELPARRPSTHLMGLVMLILCWYVSCCFAMRLCTMTSSHDSSASPCEAGA